MKKRRVVSRAAMTQAQLPQQLGDTQVSRQVRSRKKLPMSAIESSAPVSRPPLNSVPARPFVIFNAKTAQRRQLIAAIPAAFLAFSFNVLSMRGGFSCLVENPLRFHFVRVPFSGQVRFVHNSTRNRRGRRSAPSFRDSSGQPSPSRVRPDGYRVALKEAVVNRVFASVLLCTLLLVVLAFTTACGGHSNQIGTCLACPEEQAVYATTNSGQVLTFPFPLGNHLGTATSTAGPANSTGILVSGGIVYVSDPGNSAIRAYSINNQEPILSPASLGPSPPTQMTRMAASQPSRLIRMGRLPRWPVRRS